MLSSRPGRVIAEYRVPDDGPRGINTAQTASMATTITERLREEMGGMATDQALHGLDQLELQSEQEAAAPSRFGRRATNSARVSRAFSPPENRLTGSNARSP